MFKCSNKNPVIDDGSTRNFYVYILYVGEVSVVLAMLFIMFTNDIESKITTKLMTFVGNCYELLGESIHVIFRNTVQHFKFLHTFMIFLTSTLYSYCKKM